MLYTKEQILDLLQKSNKAVEHGLVAIYEKQTSEEQKIQNTVFNNSVGFNAVHAHTGSYLARWIKSGKHLDGQWLDKGREIILHYSGQLTKIANKEKC